MKLFLFLERKRKHSNLRTKEHYEDSKSKKKNSTLFLQRLELKENEVWRRRGKKKLLVPRKSLLSFFGKLSFLFWSGRKRESTRKKKSTYAEWRRRGKKRLFTFTNEEDGLFLPFSFGWMDWTDKIHSRNGKEP